MKGKFESNRRVSEKKMGNCVMVITSGLFKIISSGAHTAKWLIEKSFFLVKLTSYFCELIGKILIRKKNE